LDILIQIDGIFRALTTEALAGSGPSIFLVDSTRPKQQNWRAFWRMYYGCGPAYSRQIGDEKPVQNTT